jgi:hypothetical protein
MKKLTFIFMTILLIFAITGCIFDVDKVEKKEGEKKFWALNTSTGTFYQLTAEKLTENSKCVVWAEKGSGVTEKTAILIANEYANNICTKMINNFGWEENIKISNIKSKKMNTMETAHFYATGDSNNAKLTILLLDIKDGYQEGVNDSYVAGYFYQFDLLASLLPQGYKSNNLDMLYIDTNPGLNSEKMSEAYITLAHEMQHLMNCMSSIMYRVDNRDLYLMDLWIDEGLSSAAERVYSGEHSMNRVEWFKLNGDGKGKIDKGNNFYVWNNRVTESDPYPVLDDYATVYLFFQWLRLQSNDSIYKEIIKSEYPNYDQKAVIKAFNAKKSSGANYSTWENMLKDWLMANNINSSSGRIGYMDDSTLKDIKAHYAPEGTTTIGLYPGEGVYSYSTSNPSFTPVGKIKYEYLSDTNTLITYNSNTVNYVDEDISIDTLIAEGTTTGRIPPTASIVITGSINLKSGASKFSGPFPIGMGDVIRGTKTNNPLKFDGLKIERVIIDE